jgi:hypothetical protein
MNTPGVPKRLQAKIRKFYAGANWNELATELDITLKSVQHMLNPKSPRELTFHFCGLLAVKLPDDWGAIQVEMSE